MTSDTFVVIGDFFFLNQIMAILHFIFDVLLLF